MTETDMPASPPTSDKTDKIISRVIEQEMIKSYLSYAMSVIVGRALPDVRDGLKPVHRRVLFGMWELGMLHNKPFKKSARIVGEILGKFHPHSDVTIYDTLVRMAQNFSLRYPLVQGQGNFGSVDGDNPAAMRYCVTADTLVVTEKGLIPIAEIANKEDIDIRILSKDRKINKATKWFDSGEHQTLKVTTRKGYAIEGSVNHPLLTLSAAAKGRPIFAWKRLDELRIGDVLVLDRSREDLWPQQELDLVPYYPQQRTPRTKRTVLPRTLTKDLAFILGALCSEGTISKNKIEFCNTDIAFIDAFTQAWEKTFPDTTLHRFKRNASSYGKKPYVRLESHFLFTIDFLKNIGLLPVRSAQKSVPQVIFLSPKHVVSTFLQSYFEGDGSISHAKKMVELSCCSASTQLMQELQILLLRFGIDTFRRFDAQRTIHKLYLRGKRNVLKFYKQIGFQSERKNKKLEYVILHYKKDSSQLDYVPFISEYIRERVGHTFVEKMNFDRYSAMQDNYQTVSNIVLQRTGEDVQGMFEYFLTYDYLFEQVASVQEAGIQRVYSVKVASDCHSFVANGFINHNTEARLSKIAEEILIDLDKDTVDFVPNFDGSLKEPTVMPGKLPNLLINGSTGIAVGMATNIPPHNIHEVCSGIIATIDNPQIETKELLQHVTGPDFPTGAIIQGRQGIIDAYSTGRGKVTVKAKAAIEQHKGKDRIIITEIPYMVNKSQMIEQIADLVRDGKIKGISDIRDESDENIRVVIELKTDAEGEVVLNQLYKYSRLSETFSIIMLALVENEPKVLNLKAVIQYYISHRQVVVRRRTQFELTKAEQRVHVLEGLIIALNNIDEVVRKIKQSADAAVAEVMLQADYALSEIQAKAILDMKLQRLASLEQEKIRSEHQELLKLIVALKDILASEQKILDIIKAELMEVKEAYADARKTVIEEAGSVALETEDLIQEQEVVVTISHAGYIKRQPIDAYKTQSRGGKGIVGAGTREEDFVEHLFVASTHSYVLFFTDKGKVYWLKIYEIPEASRQAKGKAIINLIKLEAGEKIEASIPVKTFDERYYLVLATKKGTIKKTNLSEYSRPRQSGIIALTLEEGDSLVNALLTDGNQQIILTTQNGMAVKFHEQHVRPIGRTAMGVRGISLREGDAVVDIVTGDDAKALLTVTEHGYGKRSKISDYRQIARGGIGVINIQCTNRNGKVVATKTVDENDEVMFISQKGIVIRTPVQGISVIGRNTQGVRIMKMESGDKVIDCAKIVG